MPSRALPLPLLAALLVACGGDPEPRPAREEPAPVPASPAAAPAPAPPAEPASRVDQGMTDPAVFSPGIVDDDPATWRDETSGPAATIIYVTRKGDRFDAAPMALVFSSDPSHRQFQRRDSERVSVLRFRREGMGALLGELERDGLSRLPWSEEPYDQQIGPERALLLFRDGRRTRVAKAGLDGPALQAFAAVERRLIRMTFAR